MITSKGSDNIILGDSRNAFEIEDLGPDWEIRNGFNSTGSGMDYGFLDLSFGEEIDDGLGVSPVAIGAADDLTSPSEVRWDISLSYISQILMEEDVEEKIYVPADPALVAAEKPFCDVLNDYQNPCETSPSGLDSFGSLLYSNDGESGVLNNGISSSEVFESGWLSDFSESRYSQIQSVSADYTPESSFDSFTSLGNGMDGEYGCQRSGMRISELHIENQWVHQFEQGLLEDASLFIAGNGQSVFGLQSNNSLYPRNLISNGKLPGIKEHEEQFPSNDSRGRKNHFHGDLEVEEGRGSKLSASSCDETMASKMFEDVLHLCIDPKGCGDGETVNKTFPKGSKKNATNGESKRSSRGKSQSRKQTKLETIDLGALLLHCAQSVAGGDRRAVNEQLQLIRQHSSLVGDGSQRLAHYFADGLEARLAGMGSQIHQSRLAKQSTTAADILKAFFLYMGVCPFRRISHFFANQSILNVADRATQIHVIDFGIGFGFQWPCLFRRLSLKKGGPPKLKITGIDLPQPGFRPRERLEETGRRLTECARRFNVPFEYCGIASKWENIRTEDLHLEEGEILIVNCLYMLRNLADETLVTESPRSIVLNNIKGLNPDLFVVGVMSSAYGSPFFITRFREALFYYSALFDVLESNVPREDPYRLLIEREFFGREAMNIIACEGSDRVYRPETYKQWRMRIHQAGFKQLPLDSDIVKNSRHTITSCYDRNFIVEEDNNWMLLGWKGRVLYGLSTWKPAQSGARI